MGMRYILNFVLLIAWLAGISLACGFWSTFAAVIFPFWAWYLVVEHIVERFL